MSGKQNNNEQINNFKIKEINIKDNKKNIYKALWQNNSFFKDKRVQKVFSARYKKYSDNSYAFQIKDNKGNVIDNKKISNRDCFDSIYEKLTEIFGIKGEDKGSFKEKLKEACSGSGSEQRRITTLHSSSLCALLFFYNVSKKNQLTLRIGSREITFKNVLFEFQNTVIKEPSNVDVVLLGEIKEEKKKVILFLESKFLEYLDVSRQFTDLGLDYLRKYKCIYNDNSMGNIGLSIIKKNNNPKIFEKKNKKKYNGIETTDKPFYIEGIKQMISHYIGITNLLEGKFYNKGKNHEKLETLYTFLYKGGKLTSDGYKLTKDYENKLKEVLKNAEIYLGEILFDFHNMNINISNKETFEEYFDKYTNYSSKYTKLAEILNELEEKEGESRKKITILPQLLTYSLFKDNKENSKYKIEHKIENKIKEYYKLNKNK